MTAVTPTTAGGRRAAWGASLFMRLLSSSWKTGRLTVTLPD